MAGKPESRGQILRPLRDLSDLTEVTGRTPPRDLSGAGRDLHALAPAVTRPVCTRTSLRKSATVPRFMRGGKEGRTEEATLAQICAKVYRWPLRMSAPVP